MSIADILAATLPTFAIGTTVGILIIHFSEVIANWLPNLPLIHAAEDAGNSVSVKLVGYTIIFISVISVVTQIVQLLNIGF